METLLHITTKQECESARESGRYTPQAFESDGFIHCSYSHQVCATANRIFVGQEDLVLLEIDRSRITCEVIDENVEGGEELFPHIYGDLSFSAVINIHNFPSNEEGIFELPQGIES